MTEYDFSWMAERSDGKYDSHPELYGIFDKYIGNSGNWFMKDDWSIPAIDSFIEEVHQLSEKYPSNYYPQSCLSDLYFVKGDYDKALFYCPKPDFKQQWTLLSNRRINLKILNKTPCDSLDYLTLFPKKVTAFGRKNITEVAQYLDIELLEWAKRHDSIDLIDYIINNCPIKKWEYFVFNGMPWHKRSLKFYQFEASRNLEEIIIRLSREAENTVREEKGIPKIGEGWIAETELFHAINSWLKNEEVIPHARPDWLKPQHLDIFIPRLNLAIEYQGLQHDQPVAYFGGEKAYQETKKRDAKKKRLCKKNNINLVYVKEGYRFDEVKDQILTLINAMNCNNR